MKRLFIGVLFTFIYSMVYSQDVFTSYYSSYESGENTGYVDWFSQFTQIKLYGNPVTTVVITRPGDQPIPVVITDPFTSYTHTKADGTEYKALRGFGYDLNDDYIRIRFVYLGGNELHIYFDNGTGDDYFSLGYAIKLP
jgi:hypothetical protein